MTVCFTLLGNLSSRFNSFVLESLLPRAYPTVYTSPAPESPHPFHCGCESSEQDQHYYQTKEEEKPELRAGFFTTRVMHHCVQIPIGAHLHCTPFQLLAERNEDGL